MVCYDLDDSALTKGHRVKVHYKLLLDHHQIIEGQRSVPIAILRAFSPWIDRVIEESGFRETDINTVAFQGVWCEWSTEAVIKFMEDCCKVGKLIELPDFLTSSPWPTVQAAKLDHAFPSFGCISSKIPRCLPNSVKNLQDGGLWSIPIDEVHQLGSAMAMPSSGSKCLATCVKDDLYITLVERCHKGRVENSVELLQYMSENSKVAMQVLESA